MKEKLRDLALAFVMGASMIIWFFSASLKHKPEPPPKPIMEFEITQRDTNYSAAGYVYIVQWISPNGIVQEFWVPCKEKLVPLYDKFGLVVRP